MPTEGQKKLALPVYRNEVLVKNNYEFEFLSTVVA
jgi:hypothetical protein